MSVTNLFLKYITPDEQMTWDTKQIANEIPGFEFKGPGWYSKIGSWMLVIATNTPDVFTIQVFYDRDPRWAFQAAALAPVRTQETPAISRPTDPDPLNFGGLIVLLIGMMGILPLTGFLLHRFGVWGLPMSIGATLVLFLLAWWIYKPRKREKT